MGVGKFRIGDLRATGGQFSGVVAMQDVGVTLSLTVNGVTKFTTSTTFNGPVTFNSSTTFNGPITFASASTINGPVTFSSATTFNGPPTFATATTINTAGSLIMQSTVPTTITSAGTPGTVIVGPHGVSSAGAAYVFFCFATNTWSRIAFSSNAAWV